MNPNAKEFVPAHLLKKRQEEAEAKGVSELSKKLDEVSLDKSSPKRVENGDSRAQAQDSCKDGPTRNNPQKPLNGKGGDTIEEQPASSQTGASQENNAGSVNQTNNYPQHNNQYTNGRNNDLERGYDDQMLLKAGENYCEFNGEEFIVPGDDEEYEGEIPNAGYDFGNAEDNDDQDIANAFEEFLDNLPE